jgi:hypothetical protein
LLDTLDTIATARPIDARARSARHAITIAG